MKVVVTGARGFLGQNVVEALLERNIEVVPLGRQEGDLLDPMTAMHHFKGCDIVVHLAANVGGIGYLREHRSEAFFENYAMGLNVINACLKHKPKRLILAGTPCSYSAECPLPLLEDDLFSGLPSGDTGTYGMAKLASSIAANALCISHGIDVATVIPSNLYGPHDRYNETSSHVVAALLTKALRTKSGQPFEVWGNGEATRDFIYVGDVASGIANAVLSDQRFEGKMMNLGSGVETSIASLAKQIANVVGRGIYPQFQPEQPVGYTRRVASIKKANEMFGYTAPTSLEEGLINTIKWIENTSSVKLAGNPPAN